MKSLSIVHIEDEYREFLSLSTTVKTMIEDYWLLARKKEVIARRRQIAQSSDSPQNWVVYEMTVENAPDHVFRYIFVRDAKLPKEVEAFLLEERAFILDALRPMENSTVLGLSVKDSLKSIEPFITDPTKVVMYTAHQGTGLDSNENDLPRKINKENDHEIEEFLSLVILGSFDG